MSETQSNTRDRVKLAAIPVLALILFWVLTQGEDDAGQPPAALADPGSSGAAVPSGSIGERRSPPEWPALALSEILAHDPFAVPPALAPDPPPPDDAVTQPVAMEAPDTSARDRARARRELLAGKRVSLIYRGPAGPTAVIDSREYREGDMLSDGVRIVEIRRDGVIVEIQDVY
jgi:hypothetical protein